MATVLGVPKEIKDMEGRVSMQLTALPSWCTTATRW